MGKHLSATRPRVLFAPDLDKSATFATIFDPRFYFRVHLLPDSSSDNVYTSTSLPAGVHWCTRVKEEMLRMTMRSDKGQPAPNVSGSARWQASAQGFQPTAWLAHAQFLKIRPYATVCGRGFLSVWREGQT